VEIEFDEAKARANLKKHGISFEEAATALLDERALSMEDPYTRGESRYLLVGLSDLARLLTVVYTFRRHRIRLISARKASKREIKHYAKGI
jgi:uncharacterized DUF497 family protein